MDSQLPRELQAAYDSLRAAVRAKDLPALMKTLSLDFTRQDEGGATVGLQQFEAAWKKKFAEAASYDVVLFASEEWSATGNEAVVSVRRTLYFTAGDSQQEDFEESHVQDTWVRTAAGWRLKHQKVTAPPIEGSVQRIDSPSILQLAHEIEKGNLDALTCFWEAARDRTPLVESVAGDETRRQVTFIWRAEEETLNVELHFGSAPKPLVRLAETDLWYRTERLPSDARLVYVLSVTRRMTKPGEGERPAQAVTVGAFRVDPLNPHRFRMTADDLGGSVVELPDAPVQPWRERQPGVTEGKLSEQKIRSEILKEERVFTLYLPPDYHASAEVCDLLIMFDGETVRDLIPAPVLLDNLIAHRKIRPTVAALVHSQDTRGRDLSCSEPFADFLACELVPWLRERQRLSTDPQRVTISGISLGGLMAAYCGLRHSELFGNVLSQSGSFWYYAGWPATPETYATEHGWLARQFAMARRLPLHFYLEVGRFESANKMLPSNRWLRDVLQAKGYPVTYREFHGGHSYLSWRGSLDEGLIALIGTQDQTSPAG